MKIDPGSEFMRRRTNFRGRFLIAMIVALMIVTGLIKVLPTRAESPLVVSLSTSNFSLQTLAASADDLSNTDHVLFSLHNGTMLWYAISVQSTPNDMTPTPANPSTDLVTKTYFGSTPLLPPAGILPFDTSNGPYHFETLKLTASFSGPNQQIQLSLSPYDFHAVTLDMLDFILQLLGEKNSGMQIGLLSADNLKTIFDATSSMKDFESLLNDYVQVLQAVPDTGKMLGFAYACATDLVLLLTNPDEQKVLGDLLWQLLGKAILRESISKALANFSEAQFGLGVEGFLKDETMAIGSILFESGNPTVSLQSKVNTPTPTPDPKPSPSRSIVSASHAIPTPLPTMPPVPTPTRPLPSPTRSFKPTPTATRTRK